MQKKYNIQTNIGLSKYIVNYYNGEKTHPDGSEFFDIAIFKNKKELTNFTKQLDKEKYEFQN